MKINPLILLAELLIVLIMIFGLDSGAPKPPRGEDFVDIPPPLEPDEPADGDDGHGASGLRVMLLAGDAMQLPGEEPQPFDAELLRQRMLEAELSGVSVVPHPDVPWSQVEAALERVAGLGVAVEIRIAGGNRR